LLNLTVGDPLAKPAEFEVEFFDDEQRKIYRDETSPLTDEDRKILESGGNYRRDGLAADSKRILIAPVMKKERGSRNSASQTTYHYTILHFSDKKRTIYQNSVELHHIEERDMVEIHFAEYPNVASVAILEPIKVASFKRERPKIEDLKRQVFFKDEIVPLTEEDKEIIKKEASIGRGCVVFLAVPSVAFAVYWFFYSTNETAWRFVFGGVGAFLAILCAVGLLLTRLDTNDEIKNNKKRVITAPVPELFTRTVFGKPTKFYAVIKTPKETLEREIPAETYLDLESGDIIELEFTTDTNSETTLREVTKIANALEANAPDADGAEIR
jgi:hypothetical protein